MLRSDIVIKGQDFDPTKSGVIAHDKWHRITQAYGNVYVSVETDDREHHMTCRAAAARFVRENLGPNWHICAYVGREHYRNVMGYPSWARRYSVVRIGAA